MTGGKKGQEIISHLALPPKAQSLFFTNDIKSGLKNLQIDLSWPTTTAWRPGKQLAVSLEKILAETPRRKTVKSLLVWDIRKTGG